MKKTLTVGVVALLLAAFSVTSAWALVGDYRSLGVVPTGVTLRGHDLSGLSEQQLRAEIDRIVSSPAMQPLSVQGDGRSWLLDPRGVVTVDTQAMVDEAYAPARTATLATRLMAKVTGAPLTAEVKPVYDVDKTALAAWVARTAHDVDRAPVNATRTVEDYAIKIVPEVYGASVDQTAAVAQLSQTLTSDAALAPESRTASLPVTTVKPKIVRTSFKTAIVVALSQTLVKLYSGDKLVKTYRCAPGQPAWPTPVGDFHVIRKSANAPWINPNSAWSVNMPPTIPGGPNNPMGDRKIAINVPGIYLHGIPPSEFGSIGSFASHGCMRMMPSAIHDLYPRVHVGDPVFIRK